MDIYHDSLHQLVRPLIIKLPETKQEIRKKITELHNAARQEILWSNTAYNEGMSERARGLKLKKNDPMRSEHLWDSKVAFDFCKIRKKRADMLIKLADRLKIKMERMP